MNKYTKKYSWDIPWLLRPSTVMWRNHIMNLNSLDNELAFVISCGKIVIGYTYMYYVDYDDKHYVFFHIVIDENHLYEEAVSICIEKAKVFLNDNKQNHKLEEIRFYLNDSSIIMEHASFYKKALLNNGFISNDNEMYYLK